MSEVDHSVQHSDFPLTSTDHQHQTPDNAVRIGVLTSGGDAQGMNAVVRAVVRTALHEGAIPFAIREGWKGAVFGGDLIQEMSWNDVSGILAAGGTHIGTARCAEFRERAGIKQAVKNLVEHGIDRLVIIGGDGTLSGADELRELWPELLAELATEGEISAELAHEHQKLHIAGVVGSIDNDLVGTDMTIGADSALHRIVEALDALSSTAASHQRTFVIEVMGRRCGYLALMSAIAGGCDYVFIPELPPADGWEDAMCEKLRIGRAHGRRDSMVIVAEGATDRAGNPITATMVKEILEQKLGEDARVTSLGHVQRGGTPSAYDRWMPTLLGYTAAHDVIHASDSNEPVIIGTQRNRLVRLPMMETIKNTRAVKDYLAAGNWDAAIASRGKGYREMIDIFETISWPVPTPKYSLPTSPRVAIVHAGGLAPGMNAAARAAVKLGLDRGFTMLGVEGGFPGLLDAKVRELNWGDVEGWVEDGGAELGTRRTIASVDQFYQLSRGIENARIDALIVIGGFKGYKAAYEMVRERDRYPAFRIPIICVPASIDNNLPGSELAIGADTALNNNAQILDRIKQSASASQRCFVAETMGRRCGYLALMSAITTGAEQVYLSETGITLPQLAEDTARMINAFKGGRNLYLVIRNEDASEYYTTDFISRIFEEEGGGLFDVRSSILGHMQQGGNPTPFDRTLAVRMMHKAIDVLYEQFEQRKDGAIHVGQHDGVIEAFPISHMPDLIDMESRLPYEAWWHDLKDVLYVMADQHFDKKIGTLPLVIED
ncbi:6-phosphofructokinase [Arcanobacterium bovis]|uniref:6-phosphofructokinase n=1 Tax=Arcanobacterium bovis TaxID=2529275 RepID=A0A4Q9V0J8_9ACTO|nr:6-phosphofructokinase [Arcanobacterium bovis]TBW22158.1 6-phosphofructokinase [Arcanobacterium bovis]